MDFVCDVCKKTFSTKYSLERHKKNVHNVENATFEKSYFSKCNDCVDLNFKKKTLLINHLNSEHGMTINKEILHFINITAFYNWKMMHELEEKCKYVLNTGKKNCKDGSKSYYECCRSGTYKEKDTKERSTKSKGTKKINYNCTSHIILLEPFDKEECIATVYRQHYGHTTELQHLDIPINKKMEIASKISQGVTFGKILDNIRGNIDTNLNRENLITRVDIHNIKRKYNLVLQDGQLQNNDSTSDNNWVEQMKKQGENNHKNKSTSRINEIKKQHNRSVSLNLNINFDNNKWNVQSGNSKHTFYSITKCLDDICCPLICSECKICIHSYQCTCPDYQIKSIICKHIHIVAMDTTTTNTTIVKLTPETEHQTSNIGEEMEVHIKSIQRSENSQSTSILQAKFKDKAIHLSNLIQSVDNPEYLKVAMQKLDALTAFINVASNENEVIPYKTDQEKEHANKKITQQKSFFSTKNKKFKATHTITRPTSHEIKDLNDTLLHKKCVILKENDNEHSYF